MCSELGRPLMLACGVTLPNRLCKAAMTEALADALSRSTPAMCRLYERWSQGGAGLLITGNVQVDRRYLERPGNVCIEGPQDAEQIERLRALAAAGTAHGSRCFVQLSHAGRQTNAMINLRPAGPGSVPLSNPHGLPTPLAKGFYGAPRALSALEVEDVVDRFAIAAQVCRDAGFDGVQLHSAHGYLLSSFLNPRANNREALFGGDDPYGGSLEKRARVLLDAVRAVRARVGPDFAIAVKLNSADFQRGGFTPEEASRVAVWLEAAGVDLLELSGGNYESGIYAEAVATATAHSSAFGGLPLPFGQKPTHERETTTLREAYFLHYAVRVQQTLTRMPVMVTGGWRTRGVMVEALAKGDCALIGLGRPMCSDPDCARKLLSGEVERLPCFEDTLQVGIALLGPLFRVLPPGIRNVLRLGSLQCWFYRNIVALAERGTPRLGMWPFVCFVANLLHEAALAKGMCGADCVGTIKGTAAAKLFFWI